MSPATHAQLDGTVLVIDDEAFVRESIRDILTVEGIDVALAPDGPAGIDLFRERQADIRLIILDLSMPGLSGEETLARLREITTDTPVVLSYGYSETETAARFANLDVTAFLKKPYRWDQMLKTIRSLLGSPSSHP